MSIGHLANLKSAHFHGPVDLNGVTVGDSLVADKAIFEKDLHANGLTVQNTATFQGTVFKGPVGLADADVGGQINVSKAKFTDKEGLRPTA